MRTITDNNNNIMLAKATVTAFTTYDRFINNVDIPNSVTTDETLVLWFTTLFNMTDLQAIDFYHNSLVAIREYGEVSAELDHNKIVTISILR